MLICALETSDLIAGLSAIVALSGAGVGLHQYIKAQRWKRAEFAAGELEKLVTDESLALCCVMLDWSQRKIRVPEHYHCILEQPYIDHDWIKLVESMADEVDVEEFDPVAVVYRDVFDRFFGYLSNIESFIQLGLIELEQVRRLTYWIDQIRKPRFAVRGDESVLLDFLRTYRYDSVLRLIERFGATPTNAK